MWRLAAAFLALAGTVQASDILSASYTDPTDRYDHGILGDSIEWGALLIEAGNGAAAEATAAGDTVTWRFTLEADQVFEDTAPRLWDVTGDGSPEIVTVLSDLNRGAALVIFGLEDGTPRQIVRTPHIGQRNRWLAPVGAADLDGDGHIEVAYVDRPHLARTLRIWRFRDGDFSEIAALEGVTNHRIGETDIAGGIRDCGNGPEMIVASRDWAEVRSVTFRNGRFTQTVLAPHKGRTTFTAAMDCRF